MSKPGFRFSLTDAAAIALALAAAFAGRELLGAWALTPAVVLGHFFLFCNVFRVRRRYELRWAASFLLVAGAWLLLSDQRGLAYWAAVLATQTPLTLLAIGAEMRSPSYRGIGYARINPGRLPPASPPQGSPAPE
ncbi:MAG TPA: hypothetical protein DEA08_29175 [Planctomycetes bacterium]|nr:hypothetical protein [Planctomycetota bacterium]|tara:strand:+ start:144 stop:548 length:405 start_codon:yes stop_codon:yes gene_type:complete